MASLDEYFASSDIKKHANGAVLMGSDVSGKFQYAKALGTRYLMSGDEVPQRLDDIVFLASCTKLLTTVLALQCVERGKLDLHADVGAIVPELSGKDILTGFDEASGKPQLRKATETITLARLLTHSAGLVYDLMDADIQRYQKAVGFDAPPGSAVPQRFGYALSFEPGSAWMYGTGLDFAGLIVERVMGETLDDLMHEKICQPLGIAPADLTFWPMKAGVQDRMVDYNQGDLQGLGLVVSMGMDPHNGAKDCFGGGGMYATGPAMMKVLESLLRNDEKLLGKDVAARMDKPQLEPKAHEFINKYLSSERGYKWFGQGGAPETEWDWGFGGLLAMDAEEGYVGKNTMMWGGGINSTWFIDRENGLCGFGAPQLAVGADANLVAEMKDKFKRSLYYMYNKQKARL